MNQTMDRVFSIVAAIVTIGLVTAIVTRRNSVLLVNALGKNATAFLRTAIRGR